MSKKMIATVSFEPEKSSVNQMKALLEDFGKDLGTKASITVTKEITSLQNSLRLAEEGLKRMEGKDLDYSAYKELNKELSKISIAMDKMFSKNATSGLDTFDKDEIEEYTKAINDAKEAIIELEAKKSSNIYSSNSALEKHERAFLSDLRDPKQDGDASAKKLLEQKYTSYVRIDTIKKQINRDEERYQQLKAKDKLTPSEKKKVEELGKEAKGRKAVLAVINKQESAMAKERADYEGYIKLIKEARIEEEGYIKVREEALRQKLGEENNYKQDKLTQVSKITDDLKSEGKTKQYADADNKLQIQKDSEVGASEAFADELLRKYFSVRAVVNTISRLTNEVIKTIGDLDAAFVSIAVVTQYTNKEVWGMYDAFKGIAQTSGLSVKEIAGVAGEYFRQGESYSNVLQLTEAAAMAAKVAGIEASDSVRYLTSAIRGYNLEASDAMIVSDKFAAVAAATATDYDGLATAMSKVAAQAHSNGVEFDNLMGMMATAMDVTQEAPENIGTAFKTIFARMSEIKDFGAVLEDGMDANNIEKALKTVNVQLFDQNREMRDLDKVLLEVGSQWSGLSKSQKAYLATALAGTRQQTRLLAVFENYDTVLKNIEISQNSAGATEAQQVKNMQSMEHAMTNLTIAFEQIITNISESEFIIDVINGLANGMESFASFAGSGTGKIILWTAAMTGAYRVLKSMNAIEKVNKGLDGLTGVLEKAKKNLDAFEESSVSEMAVGLKAKLAPLNKELLVTSVNAGRAKLASSSLGQSFTALKSLITPTTIALGLLVGAVVIINKAFKEGAKSAEEFGEAMSKNRAALYDLNEKSNSLEDLVKEYDKLSTKVLKTTEDLERQAEILKLLNDIPMDTNLNFDDNGKLNKQTVEDFRKQNDIEKDANFNERIQASYMSQSARNKLQGADLITQRENEVIRSLNLTRKGFEELDSATLSAILRIKEYDETILKVGYGSSLGYTIDAGGARIQDKSLTDTYSRNDAEKNEELLKNIEYYNKLTSTIDKHNITLAEYNRLLLEGMSQENLDLISQGTEMGAMMENYSNYSNITIGQLEKLDLVLTAVKDRGIEVNEGFSNLMVEMMNNNFEGFFSELPDVLELIQNGTTSVSEVMLDLINIMDDIPLDNLVQSMQTFDSMKKNVDSVNSSLEVFNADSLKEVLTLMNEYSEFAEDIANSITQTGEITDEVYQKMAAGNKELIETNIKNEIEQNKARIEILKAQQAIALAVIADETALMALAKDEEIIISEMTVDTISQHLQTLEGNYTTLYENLSRKSSDAGKNMAKNLLEGGGNVGISGGGGYADVKGNGADANRARMIQARLAEMAQSMQNEMNQLAGTNTMLQYSLDNLSTGEWNKEIEKAKKGAKDAGDSIEIYIGQLHKLYVAQQRLAVVDWGLNLIKSQRAYRESADAVAGLVGANEDLVRVNAAQSLEDEYAALKLYSEQLANAVVAVEAHQKSLVDRLNPALNDSYKIINGRVIPVSNKYKTLTGEQMKQLDEFAKSYNDLNKEMKDYETQLLDTAAAQNKLIAEMRDAVIDYQQLLIDTIKNEEKKQLESFKKMIDANKKYIDERKKLYENAFEDEDSDKAEADLEEQRLELIEKLANLESAHDLNSLKLKEEYRKQLLDLDEQYNLLVLERNREALLESLDNQIAYQDEIYANEEAAYQARIESGIWLEERMKQIQDEARVQAILDNIAHNTTIQQMLDAGYITQEEITRMGLTDMNTTIDQLSAEQLAVLTDYWGKNRDVIDKMWNSTGEKVGAVKLSEDAMNKILKYLEAHSTQMEGKTKLMQEKVTGEWKSMMSKVNEYTKSFNAITLTGPNTKPVTDAMKDLVKDIGKHTEDALAHYDRLIDKANATASAAENAKKASGGTASGGTAGAVKNSTSGSRFCNSDGCFNSNAEYQEWLRNRNKNPGNYSPFATGGTTERTGLHWLDGTPGKPERVLSPGANRNFEAMLAQLTIESKNRRNSSDLGVPIESYSSNEVVDSIDKLSQIIVSSDFENAMTIVQAIREKEIGDTDPFSSVITREGISPNKR